MKVRNRYQSLDAAASRARADDLCAWLRDYASRRINSRLIDERRTIPPHVLLDFGNQGVFGVQVEERFGGLALRSRDVVRFLEQAAAVDLAVGTFILVCLYPGVRPIAAFGSDALKEEFLPALAAGRALAGYGQTEPLAGTHFPAMQTRAVRGDDGSWRISGDKVWIGNSSWARVLTVMAHDHEGERRKGLSAFAVPVDGAGVFPGRELLSMGMRGVVQGEICFRDAVVGEHQLLGERGRGLDVGVDSMSFSRLAIAATCIGAMKRAAQDMLRFAERRSIATGRLVDHPVALASMGETTARIAGAEAVLYRAADLLDEGREVPVDFLAVAKIVASEFVCQTADALMQLLGSRGYDEANLAPQLLRDARVTRIFEGTSEALVAYIGSQAISPRSDLHGILRDDLAAPALAEAMAETVSEMKTRTRLLGHPEGEDPPKRTWQVALAGWVGVWAVVCAALEQRAASERHRAWARAHFDGACRRALTGSAEEIAMLSPAEMSKAVSAYAAEIGEVEQQLPAEKQELDSLLRPSGRDGD